MYGYLIKKSFCDDWDNLLTVVVVNLIALASGVLIFLSGSYGLMAFGEGSTSPWLFVWIIATVLLFSIVLSIINFAFGELAAQIADFNGVRLKDFFKAIPGVLKDAILFALLIDAIVFVSIYCIDFYFFKMANIFGALIGAFIFWMDIFIILSLQWFIPLRATMHNNFKKCLKKCFLFTMDNTGFSIFNLLHTLVLTFLSVFLVGFFPSFCGISIFNCNALKVRLYKYDYLEEHPELKTKKERKNIPWDELIFDDRETLGPRKLKSFLFPWKEN